MTIDLIEHEEVPHRRVRGKTVASHPYGMEMRYRPGAGFRGFFGRTEWTKRWRWYATAERRDAALAALNRKDRCFEYRPVDRRAVV